MCFGCDQNFDMACFPGWFSSRYFLIYISLWFLFLTHNVFWITWILPSYVLDTRCRNEFSEEQRRGPKPIVARSSSYGCILLPPSGSEHALWSQANFFRIPSLSLTALWPWASYLILRSPVSSLYIVKLLQGINEWYM